MNTFSKLVVINGLIYQEIRDYNGKLLLCRRFIEEQHPPEHRGLDKALKEWKILVKEVQKDELVSPLFKVKEKPLPLKPYWVGPVKRVEEVDFSEDDEYYFSYLRYAGTVEFVYGKMSKLINTLTDELALGKSDPKGFGADYGLSQEVKDKLRWKEFITDNMFNRISALSGGSNPLYEDRPLTWEEIDNMEGIDSSA